MKKCFLLTVFITLIYGHALHSMTITKDTLKKRVVEMGQRVIEEPAKSYEILSQFITENPEETTIQNEKTGNTRLHDYVIVFCQKKYPLRLIGAAALFAKGADPNTQNLQKKSPLHVAQEYGNTLLIALFETKNPTKQDLIQLARNHKQQALLTWLV